LEGLASKIPDNQSIAAANVQGKIADVTGNTCIINVGKTNGVVSGDNLQVERVYKTVKDPVSGKVLKELTSTIAIINVTSVDPESSTGNVVKGTGVRVGDTVRKVTTDVSAVLITPVAGSSPTKTGSAVGAAAGAAASAAAKSAVKSLLKQTK
jgi:hypothetical protein